MDDIQKNGAIASERLFTQITKAGPGTVAAGAQLHPSDVWAVLSAYHMLRLDYLELEEAYKELLEEHNRCV